MWHSTYTFRLAFLKHYDIILFFLTLVPIRYYCLHTSVLLSFSSPTAVLAYINAPFVREPESHVCTMRYISSNKVMVHNRAFQISRSCYACYVHYTGP